MLRLIILAVIIFSFIYFTNPKAVKNIPQFAQAQKAVGNVLGAATGFVLKNTAESIAKQIDKLPKDQQKQLKQRICK